MRFLLSLQCCTLKGHCQPNSERKNITQHTQAVFVFTEESFSSALAGV